MDARRPLPKGMPVRLPAAVQVPSNWCHSPLAERGSEVRGARLQAIITSRPVSAIARRGERRKVERAANFEPRLTVIRTPPSQAQTQ